MRSFLERLEGEVLVMSGAQGTMVHRKGADLGGCIGKWIVDHPEDYRELSKDYFEAGCHIVSAATSSLNRIILGKFNLAIKAAELTRGVVKIVQSIKPEGTFLSASIGPTGKLLKPLGEVSLEEAMEAYSEQAGALAESGVDFINLLTFFDLEEAVAALRAVKTRTNLPVIVSLSYNPTPKGYRTMMGVSPEAAAERLEAEGADVIGANCGGISLSQATEVVALMKAHCGRPIFIKPNAGLPKVVDGKESYAAGPEDFAAHVPAWMAAGARIVSACCGSTPEHLRRIAEAVKKSDQPPRA